MVHRFVKPVGATSVILEIFIEDSASAGNGKTGLAFNTASLVAYYKINSGVASVAITLATATLGTWATGGFKEVDATNVPGVYELSVPDAAFASGGCVFIMLKGAAGMFPVQIIVDLGVALTVAERTAAADALLTRSMTESYSTATGAMTLAQALHMIWSLIANRSLSSTTLTSRKLDHSTTAMTFTTDSATVPTSQTRTT